MTHAELRKLIQEALTFHKEKIGLNLTLGKEEGFFLVDNVVCGIDCIPLYIDWPYSYDDFKVKVAERVIASVIFKTGTRHLKTDGEDFYVGNYSLLYIQQLHVYRRSLTLWAQGCHKGVVDFEATGWWRWKKYRTYIETSSFCDVKPRKLFFRDAVDADFVF